MHCLKMQNSQDCKATFRLSAARQGNQRHSQVRVREAFLIHCSTLAGNLVANRF